MKTAFVKLTANTPMAQGRKVNDPKLEKESADDYESRTWRSKMHTNQKGNVIITNFALKNCISEAAKFLSKKVPGKGKSTYTKHFEAGIMVLEPLETNIKAEKVIPQMMFVPTDGVRGGNKRCNKYFPIINDWEGTAKFLILDETITKDVFLEHLQLAGNFIGLGSFRPRNNGYFGRFDVELLSWN